MGTVDKMKDKAQEARGGTKAGVGAATGDRSMEAEGKMDKAGANLKQAGEKIKDAAKS
jgi:uncharacterized protein YjbJ (UPF0337 family)